MQFSINPQFYNTAQQARLVVSNMQSYLNDYQKKVVGPEYAEKKEKETYARQKQINTLLAFIITAENNVNEIMQQLENEYKRGFLAGQERERKQKQYTPTPLEREALRSYNNIKQYHKWADHF